MKISDTSPLFVKTTPSVLPTPPFLAEKSEAPPSFGKLRKLNSPLPPIQRAGDSNHGLASSS